MTGLATVVAVDLAGLAAVHGNMTDLTTPVALDFFTAFLNVAKTSTGIALLLVGMVTVTSHMARLAASVAHLLPLLLRLLALSGNVASTAAVVAGILSPFTVPGNVTRFSTAIAELIFTSAASLASSPSSIRTVLDPVTSTAAPKALITTHLH